MLNLMVRVSRYVIVALVVLYTLLDLYYFTKKTERGQNSVVSVQSFLMYVLQFLMSVILFSYYEDISILIFYVVSLLVFAVYQQVYPAIYRRADRHLLNNVLFLVMLGLTVQARLKVNKAYKQLLLLVIAAIITLVVPKILDNAKKYLYRWTWFYGIGGLASLMAIMVGGRTEYGAKLSFGVAGFSIQPSEIVKITLVLFVAGMFHRSLEFKQVVITTAVAAAHVLVLVISKDLGTALIYFIAYVFMLYVATEKFYYVLAGFGCGGVAAVAAYFLFSHVRVRVATWLDPWSDISNTGWQIAQSLFGIGTGGWIGMGLTGGTPGVIPVAEKDFIFSAMCEELGIIVGCCVLMIMLGILVRFLWISTWMKLTFYKITAFGLACVFGVQILINVAGVVKLVPLTGVTLPFISYGGSSLLSSFFIFGIFEGLYMNKLREDEQLRREKAELAARKASRESAARKAQLKMEDW